MKKNDDVIVIVAGIIVSLLVVLGVGIGAAYYQQTSLQPTPLRSPPRSSSKNARPPKRWKRSADPASIIAQAGTESDWGRAKLSLQVQ